MLREILKTNGFEALQEACPDLPESLQSLGEELDKDWEFQLRPALTKYKGQVLKFCIDIGASDNNDDEFKSLLEPLDSSITSYLKMKSEEEKKLVAKGNKWAEEIKAQFANKSSSPSHDETGKSKHSLASRSMNRNEIEIFLQRIEQIQGLMIYVATGEGDLEKKIAEKDEDYKKLYTNIKEGFIILREQGLDLPDRNGFKSLKEFQGYWKLKELGWAGRRNCVNGFYLDVEKALRDVLGGSYISPTPGTIPFLVSHLGITTNSVLAADGALERFLSLLKGDWMLSVVGYFSNHRPQLSYSQLDDEYKVQDLVYCLALAHFPDLQFENPHPKNIGAVASTRVDFSSTRTQLFIEVKLATSRHDGKQVEKEISEDIVKYGKQRTFKSLVFFVYCHNYTFPNPRDFERGFTGSKDIDGHSFQTYCIVKP